MLLETQWQSSTVHVLVDTFCELELYEFVSGLEHEYRSHTGTAAFAQRVETESKEREVR